MRDRGDINAFQNRCLRRIRRELQFRRALQVVVPALNLAVSKDSRVRVRLIVGVVLVEVIVFVGLATPVFFFVWVCILTVPYIVGVIECLVCGRDMMALAGAVPTECTLPSVLFLIVALNVAVVAAIGVERWHLSICFFGFAALPWRGVSSCVPARAGVAWFLVLCLLWRVLLGR